MQALGLISRWRVAESQDVTATLAFTDGTAQATRLAAVRTLGALGADETKRLAKLIGSDAPAGLRIAGLESLARLDLPEAAALGAGMIAEGQTVDEVLQTFLNRETGGDALTTALAKARIGKAPAATALARLQSIGSSEARLMEHLGKVAGVKNNVPTYSAKYVSSLAKAAAASVIVPAVSIMSSRRMA